MASGRLTKNALAQSLKELCAERSFDEITVGDITARLGMNRQSFYYHFSDKYELLDWIYYEKAFLPLTKDLTLKNWNEKFCELLRMMKSERAFYMHTIRCSTDFFEEYLFKTLITLHASAIEKLDKERRLNEDEAQLYARFFAHGLCGTVIDWALGGMKEDEESLARIMNALLYRGEKLFSDPEILSQF